MASRRKRGPVALRFQLWLDLPLSGQLWDVGKSSQFWDVPIDVGFGSVAEIIMGI
jgi:hypothetical protein